MILDARKGDHGYDVYDAERCCIVHYVLWVDDETCRYCQYVYPALVSLGLSECVTTIHIARKIVIYLDRKLVIINPVEDNEDAGADAIATIVLVKA